MFDTAVVALILGAFGVGVAGLTEMIKRFLHVDGVLAYIVSLVVSAGCTAYILLQQGIFSWVGFGIYTAVVFLEANGLYKIIKK
jgi:hypothetical protein